MAISQNHKINEDEKLQVTTLHPISGNVFARQAQGYVWSIQFYWDSGDDDDDDEEWMDASERKGNQVELNWVSSDDERCSTIKTIK